MVAAPSFPDQGPFSDDADKDAGLVAKDAAGDNAAPLTITEISALLKRTVEDRFGFVRVRGELSGVKRAASGHLYCALKDEGARLDGVMWKGQVGRLPFQPEDGIEVIATGKLTTYPGRSNYQIVIERMEIAGEGALLALLAKLKARLEAEGLFAPQRKRPIPFLPRVIGVVTSPTGAVIRDILHRLADRMPSHVLVWPVLVQGQGAAAQIAAAVRGFSALAQGGSPTAGPIPRPDMVPRPDVIIVARGGGSVEDLWAFNEEVVVRAIAECSIPVISAVGHETDTTLADFAADLRAPTPTAAAELAVPVREELLGQLGELGLRQRRAVVRGLALGRERLLARAKTLPGPSALLAAPTQALDDAGERLRRGLSARAATAQMQLQRAAGRLSLPLLSARLERARERLASQRLSPVLLSRRLATASDALAATARLMASLDPDSVLRRGYVRVTGEGGRTLMDAARAAGEARLTLHFRDGALRAVPENAASTPPAPRAAPRRAPSPPDARPSEPPRQEDLFG